MTPRQQLYIGIGGGILTLLMIAVLSWPKHANTPAKDQQTLDSLKITAPIFRAQQDTLVLRETSYVRRVDTLVRYADRLSAVATIIHRTADSLAVIAQHSTDSAHVWHAAYDARTMEADTLRKALVESRDAVETERRARLLADTRANAATQRLTVTEDLNAKLANDIRSASECKFLWMRCPSRPAVLAAGALVGAGAMYALRRP